MIYNVQNIQDMEKIVSDKSIGELAGNTSIIFDKFEHKFNQKIRV
jgi:hypothetical protein